MPPRDNLSLTTLEPTDALTRRRLLTMLPALVVIAAGVSCGDDDDAGDGKTSTPAGGGTPGATRSIDHMYGSTEVSGTPKRIVTVGWTEQDAVLALGVVPIGTTAWVGDAPGAIHTWAQDKLGDADLPEVLDDSDGIQFEKIAALHPDLIIALYVPMGLSEEEYNRLSQIAPTIAPPANTPDGGISWQDLTTTVGKALDQEERAKQLVADVEAAFTKAKTDHPEFVGASGLNAYPAGDGTFQAYPPPDPGGQLLVSLGFKVPQAIIDLAAGQAWVTISAEQARLFDIDVVVWLVEDYSVRDRLLADPVYSQLNVAKQGRHVFLAYKEDAELAAATSMQTVLSLPFLIDGLSPKLAAALDGDPATV